MGVTVTEIIGHPNFELCAVILPEAAKYFWFRDKVLSKA
jgi:hypothetical protein